MIHDFTQKLIQGQAYEDRLDRYFSQWFTVKPVNIEMQKHGIDRVFSQKDNGLQLLVEYKSDDRAAKTGNAFVEIISRDTAKVLGWAYTSWAQLLVYYIPPTDEIILIPMLTIKLNLPVWLKTCAQKEATNSTYKTIGLAVPLRVLRNHCVKSYSKVL